MVSSADFSSLVWLTVFDSTLKAVFGIWDANSIEDDIHIYNKEGVEIAVSHTLRQQIKKSKVASNKALSDFIAPKATGIKDYIGAFVVTAGLGIEEKIQAFEKDHDDYNSIMLKALADRLAEAATEFLHERIRKEYWGYDEKEQFSNNELIKEKYIGIRPAPGYPACPDHTEKETIFKLLNATEIIGVSLTESLAMYPTASVSGWYFAHPDAKYFGLGKIKEDQVVSLAKRKGISKDKMMRWLSSSLAD